MDYKSLQKPSHIKDEIWKQRLHWMDVVGKQAEENCKQQQRELAKKRAAANKNP